MSLARGKALAPSCDMHDNTTFWTYLVSFDLVRYTVSNEAAEIQLLLHCVLLHYWPMVWDGALVSKSQQKLLKPATLW
jgi:hypothetical protein